MFERVRRYINEPIFALGHSPSVSAFAQLMIATLRHHMANWFGASGDRKALEEFRIRLGGAVHKVRLRTLNGDISILYEVLAEKAYHIPSGKLDPESVRIVIDAGAHIGLSTLYFAAAYPKARIISIEPDEENASLLHVNTRSIADRVTIVKGCLADHVGQLRLVSGGKSYLHTVHEEGDAIVDAFTLDSLRQSYGFDAIDLLKMDIEGGEKAVIGAGIGAVRVVIAELHNDYTPQLFAGDMAPRQISIVSRDTVLAA